MANGNQPPSGFVIDQPEPSALPEGFILDSPENQDFGSVGNVVMEGAQAINRGVADIGDFFISKPINVAMELSGIDAKMPTLNEIGQDLGMTQGGFMDEGLPRDIIQTAGEMVPAGFGVGAALRTVASALPKIGQAGESVASSVLRQMGGGSTLGDIGLTAASGVGAEIGEEIDPVYGKMAGAFLAPIGATAANSGMKALTSLGKAGWNALTKPLATMSDDGASTLLAEAMVREGLSPDDVLARMSSLGDEALPADIGNNFARLLRTASNKIPRVEGRASEVFTARNSGQGNRLLSALDDASGTASLTVDDEIQRISHVMKPKIKALYDATSGSPIHVSNKLKVLMEGDNSLGRSQKKALRRVSDKRAAGDEITNIDIIDATKQEMDDQIGKAIRSGQNNKSRDLVRLKNIMVEEADSSLPQYKQARDMFAGKMSLENAAQSGEMFFKMNPRDMQALTKTYGESERRMFKLGAKQAILDRLDNIQTNADAVKRMFGKNGDVKKLEYLFDNKESFKQFADTLNKESVFILTRRAAQANSTTVKQLSDDVSAFEALGRAAHAVATPTGAASTASRIVSGLGKGKNDEIYIKSLEEVGDILLTKGFDPERLQTLLKNGTAKQIEANLKQYLKRPTVVPYGAASITGGTIESTYEK